jgi:hypothetical protein
VGHRIIEINNQSVVAVPHEKIVNLLATSVGEVSAPSAVVIALEACTKVWELAGWTNFPCPDKISVFADPHEDDANIHVPAADRSGDARVHLEFPASLTTVCI